MADTKADLQAGSSISISIGGFKNGTVLRVLEGTLCNRLTCIRVQNVSCIKENKLAIMLSLNIFPHDLNPGHRREVGRVGSGR